ncbi:biotin--[acetyl-CoA-carboxylase] ligase [Roseibium aquae]|uniref:biotin--[biotin carboxyl-carrier protein] ligase n=1 Tax=Roseibium aquae TaxID=1323746 RepID=A0A916X284_9HYPH|nr:biotin--[acetyl-CoA-carboxylase] ligase [Roseibium aquae]GGB60503.1 biotin--[acetyl-CoA-carboxylase] ligase [Roseibium aquae]
MTKEQGLGPAFDAPGLRVERHDTVTSTNTLAFERARGGDPGGLWIVGQEQTQGRGRRGRHWFSGRGNLYASLLLIDPEPAQRIAELPLLAAVALSEAIDAACGTHKLARLKWPNDLLVDGAKVSGILLEAENLGDERQAVVLGFGVNVAVHPADGLYPCTGLSALGYRSDPDSVFQHLAGALSLWLGIWAKPDGFAHVRTAWLSRAAHLGQQITVQNGSREVTGVFRDLDDQGHLVLQPADGGLMTIYAGDVFLPGSQR